MASAFFRGHGKGRIHLSILDNQSYFQKTQCLQLEDLKLVIKIVDASNPVALIKTFIKIPPDYTLVVSNAVFHTKDAFSTQRKPFPHKGRLLHALTVGAQQSLCFTK